MSDTSAVTAGATEPSPASTGASGGPWSAARVLLAALALGAVAMVVALLLGGGAPEPAPVGLPDAGQLTGWSLHAATLLYQVVAVVAVGSLLTGVVLLPADGEVLGRAGVRAVRAVSWSAAAWALLGVATAVLTTAEIVGRPLASVVTDAAAWSQAASLSQPRALLLSAAAAAVVAAYAQWVRTPAGGWLLLAAAVLALTPMVFSGHSAQAGNHTLAVTSLVVHVVAASLWVGGLVGMLLHLRRTPAELARAVPAFSALALFCFALVGASGVLNAWSRLQLSLEAWTTGYGAITLAKAGAFLVLGLLGWLHRRHAVPAVVAGRPRAFLRLVAGELVVMGGTVGLAVSLSATPAPAPRTALPAVPEHGAGHDTLPVTMEPFSLPRLLTEWQPDVIALSLVAVAFALYLWGVRVLVGAGERWPVARTAAFGGGLLLVVLATSAGLAEYGPALFSVHIARFVTLSLAAPLLLVLARPLELAERVAPARPGSVRALLTSGGVGAALANPVNGFAGYVVVTYGLYATPLLEKSLRSTPAHLFASALGLAAGLVLMSGLLASRSGVGRERRVTVVLALALYLLVFGLILLTRDGLYAAGWFADLRFLWVEPLAEQRRGALVVLLAVPVLTPLLLLAVRGGAPQAVASRSRKGARR